MGALHPSLDPALVRLLRQSLPLDRLIESLAPGQPSAASAVAGFEHVQILAEATDRGGKDASILYWLDSHWSDEVHRVPLGPCPVLAELDRIGSLNDRSIVILDEARLFLTTPARGDELNHWPGIAELSARLTALGPNHRLWVINDLVILAPTSVASLVSDYHRISGINLARTVRLARIGGHQETIRQHVQQQRQKGRAGFNVAFQTEGRPETIFAYHLTQMGIGRVLDIGANRGQFGTALRRLGYEGEILSVEPQAEAHQALLETSRGDGKWCVLPRQATGAKRGLVDLNIAANSVSSSVRTVHPNHIRADRSTTQVRQERVFLSRSGDLLRGPAMAGIEAVKIDVQGFEDQVLEGYQPWLAGVRLLQVELSMVECYVGGPDLFSLDRQIVEDFGFRRVSLEPTYYDDATGVVQQYDGLYFRPDSVPAPSALQPPAATGSQRALADAIKAADTDRALILGPTIPPDALLDPTRPDWTLGCIASGRSFMRLPRDLVDELKSAPGLVSAFSLDRPDWDLALALVALSRGYAVKWLDTSPDLPASSDGLVASGHLGDLLGQLDADPHNYAPVLIRDLLTLSRQPGSYHQIRAAVLGIPS